MKDLRILTANAKIKKYSYFVIRMVVARAILTTLTIAIANATLTNLSFIFYFAHLESAFFYYYGITLLLLKCYSLVLTSVSS